MVRFIRLRREERDSGFTLAEMVVYSMLLIIVLGIGATMLVQTLTMQRDVRAMNDAANTAQVTFKEIERDLRNAAWAQIGGDGRLIVMQTRVAANGNDGVTTCVAYYLNVTTGELKRTSRAGGGDTQEALAATTTAGLDAATADWPITRAGIGPVGANDVFGPSEGVYQTHKLVTVAMEAETIDGRPPVVLEKSVALRTQSDVSAGCA